MQSNIERRETLSAQKKKKFIRNAPIILRQAEEPLPIYQGGIKGSPMLNKLNDIFLCLLLSFSLTSFGKNSSKDKPGWSYLYKRGNLLVYKEKAHSNAYLAEGKIPENFFEVLAVASDIKRRSEWVPNLKDSRIVEGDLESKVILYEEFALPWPAKNRDVVLECLITKDYKNKKLRIVFKNISHKTEAPRKGVIRVPETKGEMSFSFIDEKTTYASYHIKLDAGGSLPGFIVNFFVKKAPLKALQNLMKQIKKTRGSYTEFVQKHKKIAEKAQSSSSKLSKEKQKEKAR